MKSSKPSIYQPGETLLFICAIAFVGTATVAVFLSETSVEARALMATVTVAFITIWAALLFFRQRWLDRFKFEPLENVFIDPGPTRFDERDFLREVNATLISADERLAPIRSASARRFLKAAPTWIILRRPPVTHPRNRGVQLAGYTLYGGEQVVVAAMTGVPLFETAFSHELKHVIVGRFLEWTGEPASRAWDPRLQESLLKEHGL